MNAASTFVPSSGTRLTSLTLVKSVSGEIPFASGWLRKENGLKMDSFTERAPKRLSRLAAVTEPSSLNENANGSKQTIVPPFLT